MKPFFTCIICSVLLNSVHAQPAFTGLQPDGVLSLTNSVSSAVYRVESAPSLAGPWSTLANFDSIQASNHPVVMQLPTPGSAPLQLFRVVWTDAPPAQPEGDWEYTGFDPDGGLSVTGLLSVTMSAPVSGTCIFQAGGANPYPRHPVGSGVIADGTTLGSNGVALPLPTGFGRDNFRLDGQMVLDEYWGWWSYTDVRIDLSGHAWFVTTRGRFWARRAE